MRTLWHFIKTMLGPDPIKDPAFHSEGCKRNGCDHGEIEIGDNLGCLGIILVVAICWTLVEIFGAK